MRRRRWWQIVARHRCPHIVVECIHPGFHSKRWCAECHRRLDGPLPEICTETGRLHRIGMAS